jgi:hypothetical protein
MNRRTATRSALVTLGLLTLAACVVNLSFAMDKPGIVLKSVSGQTAITQQSTLVNLADYKEITDHKDNIKSFDLDYADITITAVDPTNTAGSVTGTVSLRKTLTDPPANDIAVGSLGATGLSLAVGQTVRINGTPALDAFLLQQLQSAGQFYVIVNGAIDHGVANVTVDMNLHVSIGYDAGLF